MLERKLSKFISVIEELSILIKPFVTSYNLPMSSKIVDFPDPVGPMIASVSPGLTSNVTSFKASIPVSL